MKKLRIGFVFLLIGCIALLCSCSKDSSKEDLPNKDDKEQPIEEKDLDIVMMEYIDTLIKDTSGYIPSWNKESFKGKWNYIDGVFLNSIVRLYYDIKDTDAIKANSYKNFFINYINYYINPNGSFLNLKDNTEGFRLGELDTICESKILFDAYEMTHDTRYLQAITTSYNGLMSQNRVLGSLNFEHKRDYPNQIWLDGMYMYAPFYARFAKSSNDKKILNEIRKQYEYIRNHMYDEDAGLYYHGYDATKSIFWADATTGCSKTFWLRSMGWFLVSLCDVLEYFEEGEDKVYLENLLQEAIEKIMQYQDEASKMFYQVIDKKDISVNVSDFYLKGLNNQKYQNNAIIKNYLESSGSSMIAYVLIKASNLGYISKEYNQKGMEVFEGVYKHSFKDNQLNDICITAGLGPENRLYRDGTIEYYLAEPVGSNDAKGVGPFIMAYLEYAYGKDRTSSIPTPQIECVTVTYRLDGEEDFYRIAVKGSPAVYVVYNKQGYEFAGWYTDENFNDFYINEEVTDDIILYGKLEKKKCEVAFVTNTDEYIENKIVYYGDKLLDVTEPKKQDMKFMGWSTNPYTFVKFINEEPITENLTLYAWYCYPGYEDLIKDENLYYSEDFSQYSAGDKLESFTTWKTKGVFFGYGQKKQDGLPIEEYDATKNYIDLENQKAELIDLSGNNSAILYTDFGKSITSGCIHGYLEIQTINMNESWTFLQIYGTSQNKTEIGEVFGLRTKNGHIMYRFDGDDTTLAYPQNQDCFYYKDDLYKIHFIIDLDKDKITIMINDAIFIEDISTNITSICGFRNMSSELNYRRAIIDNIAIIYKENKNEEI